MMMDLDGLPLAVRRRSGLSWDLDAWSGRSDPGATKSKQQQTMVPRNSIDRGPLTQQPPVTTRPASVNQEEKCRKPPLHAHEVSPVPLASCLAIIA